MRARASFLAFLLSFAAAAFAQQEWAKLKLRAVLIDNELNARPVPKLLITLRCGDTNTPGQPLMLTTGFDGTAEAQVPHGRCRLSTPQPVDFQGKQYSWDLEVEISQPELQLDLSRDNAKISVPAPERPAPPTEDLPMLFKRLQNSVVTVWGESGHGTGFFVDPRGLVVTNQHVVDTSEYLAVQFDPEHKIPAKLLVADSQTDVAVLWADISAFSEAIVAPIAKAEVGKSLVAEGERVFTIGSPLSQRKILTTGVVSKVESRALLSDININPGNSGGPLFNASGQVIGVTTFGQRSGGGPGISGIVRIEEALPLLEQAMQKMAGLARPPATLLPVEPAQAYPVEALRAASATEKLDRSAYMFNVGEYSLEINTPLMEHRLKLERKLAAERERQKRNKKRESNAPSLDDSPPSDQPKTWEEYAGEFQAVIRIYAFPALKEGFWSKFGRSMAAPGTVPARMHFKTDFYRMKLLCGAQEVQPIHPGRIPVSIAIRNASLDVNDTTTFGAYTYPPHAIDPACGQLTVEIYAAKNSAQPVVKVLERKTVESVWGDFEAFRKAKSSPVQGTGPTKP